MQIKQQIRCSNCGSEAERFYVLSSELTRTQCNSCDYLMVTCARTGKVIEAYAPGINPMKAVAAAPVVDRKPEFDSNAVADNLLLEWDCKELG